MNEFFAFIKNLAEQQYVKIVEKGYSEGGNNGPYGYQDTPVRNSAHWLIVYVYLWKKTDDKKYQEVSHILAEYLVAEQKKSVSGAIACMQGEQFDHLNGLIGQAWVIEALVYAATAFGKRSYYECALEIYKSQLFVFETGLWKRVELDNTVIDYDYTVNHQVWFAIAGCILNNYEYDKHIDEQVTRFVEVLVHKHFRIHSNGLIRHYLNMERPNGKLTFKSKIKRYIKDSMIPFRKRDPHKYDSKAQEKGYHLFELYGYAILLRNLKNTSLSMRKDFRKAVRYGLDIDLLNKEWNIDSILNKASTNAQMNKYAYGYNAPAFEYPYVELVFNGFSNIKKVKELFDIQVRLTYNEQTGIFDKNNWDGLTLTARIYEYIRYFELLEEVQGGK